MIMTTIAIRTGLVTAAARTRLFAAAATLKEWARAYLVWRIEAAALAQLKTMSDRELQDIGLSRSQIEPTVRSEFALEQSRASEMSSL
jgi:uncharacterized protein YjiS (DUF1127 family)